MASASRARAFCRNSRRLLASSSLTNFPPSDPMWRTFQACGYVADMAEEIGLDGVFDGHMVLPRVLTPSRKLRTWL